VTKCVLRGRLLCGILLVVAMCAWRVSGEVIPIDSLVHLEKISSGEWPLSGDYELVGDIIINPFEIRKMNHGEGFKPIGSDKTPFTGTFYGGNHKIYGLYINRPDDGHIGLFGAIGEGGRVNNLNVIADTIIGFYAVGALAGANSGVIRGCFSSGFVQAKRDNECNVGGLVGVNGGRVAASFSGATVNGRAHVGGLVGFLTSEISESYATGAVSGDNYVGGLVGYAFGGSISMSFSTGMVIGTGRKSMVGGLVGYDFGGSSASWNNAGRVTVGSNAGKLISETKMTDCYWNINTSGIAVSAGGNGATTETIKAGDSTIFKGWDFDNTWLKSDSSYYPLLQEIPVLTISYMAGANGKLKIKGVFDPVEWYTMVLGEKAVGMEVTAVPNNNFLFDRWSDGNTSAVRSDAAASNMMITAIFKMDPSVKTKTLTYSAHGGGKVRIIGPNSIVESSSYSVKVPAGGYGTEVTAVPDEGYIFAYWSDNKSSAPSRVDMALDNNNYTAIFAKCSDDCSKYIVDVHSYTTQISGGSLRIRDNIG